MASNSRNEDRIASGHYQYPGLGFVSGERVILTEDGFQVVGSKMKDVVAVFGKPLYYISVVLLFIPLAALGFFVVFGFSLRDWAPAIIGNNPVAGVIAFFFFLATLVAAAWLAQQCVLLVLTTTGNLRVSNEDIEEVGEDWRETEADGALVRKAKVSLTVRRAGTPSGKVEIDFESQGMAYRFLNHVKGASGFSVLPDQPQLF